MAEWFCKKGIAVVCLNFSHNGTTLMDPAAFGNLTAYAENTISKELVDAKHALDWITNNAGEFQLDAANITVCGHSRGGAVAIILGVDEPRATKLVTWAPVSDILKSYSKYDRKDWKLSGFISSANARTGQEMKVNYTFVEDIESNLPAYNPVFAASELNQPLLIIHGEADESVPVMDAEEIHNNCLHAIMLKIPGTGHTFGTSHPWENGSMLPAPFVELLENTLEFILE